MCLLIYVPTRLMSFMLYSLYVYIIVYTHICIYTCIGTVEYECAWDLNKISFICSNLIKLKFDLSRLPGL